MQLPLLLPFGCHPSPKAKDLLLSLPLLLLLLLPLLLPLPLLLLLPLLLPFSLVIPTGDLLLPLLLFRD